MLLYFIDAILYLELYRYKKNTLMITDDEG